jgi:uncharacterized protein
VTGDLEKIVEFEWDERKRQKTLLERGIDFIDAILIWDDPFRQERIDTRKDYGEIRYQTIGKVSLGILFVVYTVRIFEEGRPVNRVISVRPAKRKEIEQYESLTFTRASIV